MKRTMILILSVAILGSIPSVASQLPDFPFVFAHGRAESELAPDVATVSFRVKAFAQDSTNAVATVRARSVELIAFFSEQSIKKEDIVAYEMDKSTVREMKDYQSLDILGYDVGRRFAVTLHKLDQYETFMKKLLSLQNVVDIHSTFDRTDRQEIESALLAEASEDAKRQAQSMAQGFGATLGPVFAISQRGFYALGNEFGVEGYPFGEDRCLEMVGREEQEILFVPSTVKFENVVSVIFRLHEEH